MVASVHLPLHSAVSSPGGAVAGQYESAPPQQPGMPWRSSRFESDQSLKQPSSLSTCVDASPGGSASRVQPLGSRASATPPPGANCGAAESSRSSTPSSGSSGGSDVARQRKRRCFGS